MPSAGMQYVQRKLQRSVTGDAQVADGAVRSGSTRSARHGAQAMRLDQINNKASARSVQDVDVSATLRTPSPSGSATSASAGAVAAS